MSTLRSALLSQSFGDSAGINIHWSGLRLAGFIHDSILFPTFVLADAAK
jgi:hypothetical protein